MSLRSPLLREPALLLGAQAAGYVVPTPEQGTIFLSRISKGLSPLIFLLLLC
jgi:hypothetical protein